MNTEKPWYAAGLPFKCTECGKCCTGAPGYVWVNEKEMAEMALFLELPIEEFKRRYVRKAYGRSSLIEDKKTYDCIFLKEGKCTVYGARPTQCRTYPFWPQNLQSKKAWKEEAKICEGIHPEAPIVPFATIEEERLIQLRGSD